jgi:hypothetical protein
MSTRLDMVTLSADALARATAEILDRVERLAREHADAVDTMVSTLDGHYGRTWPTVIVGGEQLEREVLLDLVDGDLETLTRVRAERANRARGLTA